MYLVQNYLELMVDPLLHLLKIASHLLYRVAYDQSQQKGHSSQVLKLQDLMEQLEVMLLLNTLSHFALVDPENQD